MLLYGIAAKPVFRMLFALTDFVLAGD